MLGAARNPSRHSTHGWGLSVMARRSAGVLPRKSVLFPASAGRKQLYKTNTRCQEQFQFFSSHRSASAVGLHSRHGAELAASCCGGAGPMGGMLRGCAELPAALQGVERLQLRFPVSCCPRDPRFLRENRLRPLIWEHERWGRNLFLYSSSSQDRSPRRSQP